MPGISSEQVDQESPCGGEQLPLDRSEGWSKGSATGLRASGSSRGGEGILATILKDQGNRLGQARAGLFPCLTLPVGTRNLPTVGDLPLAVSLDDRREFVLHMASWI